MKEFSCKTKIVTGEGCLSCLGEMGIEGLFLVTDPYFYKNGTARYTYDMVTYGNQIKVKINISAYLGDYVHNGAMIVGDIHTHATSKEFSDPDIDAYRDMRDHFPNHKIYLAGYDWRVYWYNMSQNIGEDIGGFVPKWGLVLAGSAASTSVITRYHSVH